MKKVKILYGIWLAILAIVLIACSLEYKPVRSLSTVRTTGFALFAMMDILCVLMLATGCVSFSGLKNVSEEKTEEMTRGSRTHFALRQLAAFLIATGLYYVYCFPLDEQLTTTSTIDALVAGGLLCAAAVFGTAKQQSCQTL